jgi:cytochrome P450
MHRVRRRVWDRAFTRDALADYLPRILEYSGELIAVFEKRLGKIDVAKYFAYYMFDGMLVLPWCRKIRGNGNGWWRG